MDIPWELIITTLGALASIGAVTMSILTYRKAAAVKSIDLKLEINRARARAYIGLDRLRELHPRAIRSREHVSSARGRSGHSDAWLKYARNEDAALIDELDGKIPSVDMDLSAFSLQELLEKLGSLNRIELLIENLTNKYVDSFAEDDEARRSIRDQVIANPPSRKSSYSPPDSKD